MLEKFVAKCLGCDEVIFDKKFVVYANFDEYGISGGELPYKVVIKYMLYWGPKVILKDIIKVFKFKSNKYPF